MMGQLKDVQVIVQVHLQATNALKIHVPQFVETERLLKMRDVMLVQKKAVTQIVLQFFLILHVNKGTILFLQSVQKLQIDLKVKT